MYHGLHESARCGTPRGLNEPTLFLTTTANRFNPQQPPTEYVLVTLDDSLHRQTRFPAHPVRHTMAN